MKKAAEPAKASASVQSNGRGVMGLVVAASIGAGGGYFLHPPPPPPPFHATFLNCDPESTPKEALGAGWSGFEENAQGDSFMWCNQRSCTVKVTASQVDQVVRMRAFAFVYPNAPVQILKFSVNGSTVGSQPVPGTATVLTFKVPKAILNEGANELRLDFTYAESPKARVPDSGDPRTLSGGIDWLEVAPSRARS